jgi:hypothetical protein
MNDFRHCRFAWPLAVLALVCATRIGGAASLTIACEKEDVMVPGWAAPLTLSYPGGDSGDLAVTAEHVTFSLPAAQTVTTGVVDGAEVTATTISGSGETSSLMPDPEALMACVASSLQPEFKDDADVQFTTMLGCVPKVAMGASPIAVHASISLGIFPGSNPDAPDVNVEIKRSYVDIKTPTGDKVTIDTYPRNCKLVGQ